MNVSPNDLNEQWQGLEPEQPGNSRAAFWVAMLAALLLLLGALALGAFLLSGRSDETEDTISGGSDTVESTIVATDVTEVNPIDPAAAETPLPAIAATVTLPGLAAPVAQAIAGRLAAAPIVDGALDEWGSLPVSMSEFIVYSASTWDGSDDLSAAWQLAWDNEALYVAVAVTDDIHAQNQTGNTIFRGDGVELQFDTNRSGDFGPEFSPDDFQINLSPGDFAGLAPSAFRFQGTDEGTMVDAAGLHGIRVASQPTADGYVLEAAIPWGDLNVIPSAGLELGLALNVSDNDQPGTAAQEIMKSNSPNRQFGDPTTWGTLQLQ